MHFIYPPKFCVTFVFHFSWVLQASQAKLKTMPLKNFGGQIRCIMEFENVEVAYWLENPRTTASNKRKQYRVATVEFSLDNTELNFCGSLW